MSKPLDHAKQFNSVAGRARDGVSVIFDLAGFSHFFNQPDVHSYIPKYLNHITKAVEIAFFGGSIFWKQNVVDADALSVLPIHRKFLGDGYLYVWAPGTPDLLSERFVGKLINRLYDIQMTFKGVSSSISDSIPVADLPTGIRFGVARGTIYELSFEETEGCEYIGICINLASRLQKYCPGLNFIASARLNIPSGALKEHGYIKVLATKIKGFPREIVIVDEWEYKRLDPKVKDDLFAPLPSK